MEMFVDLKRAFSCLSQTNTGIKETFKMKEVCYSLTNYLKLKEQNLNKFNFWEAGLRMLLRYCTVKPSSTNATFFQSTYF